VPSIVFGVAAIKDHAYFKETIAKIVEERELAKQEFDKLGFSYLESETNFIFVTHPDVHAEAIQDELRSKHIYVRRFSNARIDNYLRVTIGTKEEMKRLFQALGEFLGK
jgi:histidinol-phosphate aminotransferase